MNEQATSTDLSSAEADVPAGYERREVIWPGTNERIWALLPLPAGWVD